jgi:raffinose/stachyose/melibiose transport system substrate-binding protein
MGTGGALGLGLGGGLFSRRFAAPAAAQDAVNVTWWVQQDNAEDPIGQYRQDAIVTPFDEANPGVTLEIVARADGENFDRVLATALQSGAGPDIVPSQGPAHAGSMAGAGLLLDMTPYSQQYGWGEKLLPWALDTGLRDGKLFLLPNELETTIAYTSQKLWDEKGWTPPTNRADFEAWATDTMGQGIIPVAMGTGDCGLCTNWLVSIFFTNYAGPDAVYQALSGQIRFDDPVFVEAIDLLNTYMQNGWLGGSVDDYFSNSFDTVHSQVANSEAAMTWEGTWFLSTLKNFFGEEAGNDNAWGWTQPPSFGEGLPFPLFPVALGSTLSISAKTEHPDEAAKVLDWYYGDKARAAQRIADFPGPMTLPLPFSPSDFPASMDPRVADIYVKLAEATANGNFGYAAWTFWPAKTHVYLHDEVQKVFTGDLSPADYCKGMADLFAEEFAEGAVPQPIPRTPAS